MTKYFLIFLLLNCFYISRCDEYKDSPFTNIFIDKVNKLSNAILYGEGDPKEPGTFDPIIPYHLHQTWKTKDLPLKMNETVIGWQLQNPDFKYSLYDDNDCRHLIKKYFDDKTLNSFDTLIPGAFKADLCRYCILYHYGGIYIDIKYRAYRGFKLTSVTDKERFVLDRYLNPKEDYTVGIYNGFMVTKKHSSILKRAIDIVNRNVENRYYGYTFLYITGPIALGEALIGNVTVVKSDMDKAMSILNEIELIYKCCSLQGKYSNTIRFHNRKLVEAYPEYRDEQRSYYASINASHYGEYWRKKTVYKS